MLSIQRLQNNNIEIEVRGDWHLGKFVPDATQFTEEIDQPDTTQLVLFNSEQLEQWDSSLVSFVHNIVKYCRQEEIECDLSGLPPGVQNLINLAMAIPVRKDTPATFLDDSLLGRIGTSSIELTKSTMNIVGFVGEVTLSFGRFLRGKARFRKFDLVTFIEQAGPQALPIVTVVNFLIGLILAFIGSKILSQFGAEIFVANLVGIAVVRELAPMMTAIIVAGRSGAAYAAQIGTMMVDEEVDALKTIGFSPVDYLVLPRILALSLMVPILVLYADFIAILGGAFVGITVIGISFNQYIDSTISSLSTIVFISGIIKGAIYGILVAFAGCMRGMQSGRSAAAVGAAATSAVVTGILFIIIASAITTVIYITLGI